MEFSRKEWSGLPFPFPGALPDPGIEPQSPALQANSLQSEPPGKPNVPFRIVSSTTILGGGGGVGVGWGWGWGACYRETVAARPLERDPECAQAGGLASPAVSVAAGDPLRGECAQRWSSAFSQGPSSSGLAGEPGVQGQAEGCVLPAELQSPRPGLQAEANLSLTSASSA